MMHRKITAVVGTLAAVVVLGGSAMASECPPPPPGSCYVQAGLNIKPAGVRGTFQAVTVTVTNEGNPGAPRDENAPFTVLYGRPGGAGVDVIRQLGGGSVEPGTSEAQTFIVKVGKNAERSVLVRITDHGCDGDVSGSVV